MKELKTHRKTFEKILEEQINLKNNVQELMSEKHESIEHIEEWSSKHEAKVQENDAPIEKLQKRIKKLKKDKNK